MPAYQADPWTAFFAAQAGAAAAVAGLLFVALSLNLQRILEFRTLPARAGETILLLVNLLLVSSLGLIPGQPSWLLGLEVLLTTLFAWGYVVFLQGRQHVAREYHRSFVFRVFICQIATLPFVAAGVSLLLNAGGGLYWVIPGVIGVFVAGFTNTWVLLVEIQR